MAILEAIGIAENIGWGVSKYNKSMQNTYTDIVIRGCWGILENSIPLVLFIVAIIEPAFITESLNNITYSDSPHRMTPVTTYDFFMSDAFTYFSWIMVYLYTEASLRHLSDIAGGYSIPKKP